MFKALPDGIDRFRVLAEIHRRVGPFPSSESLRLARRLYRIATVIGEPDALAYGLEAIARGEHEQGKHSSALRYMRRAVRLLRKAPEPPRLLAQALFALGQAYASLGRYPQAMEQYRESLEMARARRDTVRVGAALNGIGEVYRMLGDYERALDAALESVRVWEADGNHEGLGVAHNNAGTVYGMMGNHERAAESFRASLEQYRADGNTHGIALAAGNLGCALVEMGRPAEGFPYLEQSLDGHRHSGGPRYEAGTLGLLGSACLSVGDLTGALKHLLAARAIFEEIDFPAGVCETSADIGDVLTRLGRPAEAITELERARTIASDIGYRSIVAKTLRLLAEACEARGEMRNALGHYRDFMRHQAEIHNEETRRAVAWMQHRMDVDRAERDREMFRLRAERLERDAQLRAHELSAMAMRLAQKNELLASMKALVGSMADARNGAERAFAGSIIASINQANDLDGEWEAFEHRLQKLHPGFMRMLSERCSDLTPAELKVCALLRANAGSKEIATLLSTTVRTVEKHRQHIRRKLSLAPSANLITYLASL